MTSEHDRVIAMRVGGKWIHERPARHAARPNYVIVCEYGDWSGFRTLSECTSQELPTRPDGFFWIEER